MRVLIVVHGYPPACSGGAERRAERTARGLHTRHHMVRVFCADALTSPQPGLQWDECLQDGIPVRRFRLHTTDHRDPFRQSYDNCQVAMLLADLMQHWRPDVLHLFSGYLMSASVVRVARAYQVPVVVSLTDYWWLCHQINLIRTSGASCTGPSALRCARCQAELLRRYRLPAQIWPRAARVFWQAAGTFPLLGRRLGLPVQQHRAELLLQTLQQVQALIAPSRFLADFYIRHGVDAQKIRVWRQGVQLHCCPLRTSAPLLRVGFIGQVKPHKGVHVLLAAWSLLAGAAPRHLMLYGSSAGDEVYGKRIQTMVTQLAQVTWAGSFQGDQVWQVLANLDVLVVPSRWVENSPNAILEARAMGVPVVGSNLGGIAELIQHEHNGLLFECDNTADLARQLQRLLDEPDLLRMLREADMPFHSFDEEVEQLVGLYEEVRVASAPELQVGRLEG